MPVGVVDLKTGAQTVEKFKSVESAGRHLDAAGVLQKVRDADDEAAMVLAACHSLVVVDESDSPSGEMEAEEVGEDATAPAPSPVPAAPKQGPQLAGDPIELAAIKGVEWSWDAQNDIAKPGSWEAMEKAVQILETRLANAQREASAPRPPGAPALVQGPRAPTEVLPRQISELQQKIRDSKEKAKGCKYSSIRVVQRHYFSSGLQARRQTNH